MTPRVRARIRYYKMLGRLEKKIKRPRDGTGCWVWQGRVDTDEWGFYQYGVVTHERKKVRVHRVLWEVAHGFRLGTKQLVNTCGNTLCVRHDHWIPVNHWKDSLRAKAQTSPQVSAAC